MKIDKEIESLKIELDSVEDTHPDYMNENLKELQTRVLAVHAHLESVLESIIWQQIMKEEDELIFNFNRGLPVSFQHKSLSVTTTSIKLMEKITFRNKIDIVKEFNDNIPDETLKKINRYRNEFAHTKGFDLRKKYNTTSKAKQNVRDLLRCLSRGWEDMNNYILKYFPNLTTREMK